MKTYSPMLSAYDLREVEQEIDEISDTLDLCSDRDDDVVDNLTIRLEYLVSIIETSILLHRRSHLRLVA